jgi:hypothetical protein
MTSLFRRALSIRQRLLLLTMLTSGIGQLHRCAAYVILDYREERRQRIEETQSLADLMGTNATAALALDDASGGARHWNLCARVRISAWESYTVPMMKGKS